MRHSLIVVFLLCCSCSSPSPPTEAEVRGLLAERTPQPNLVRESNLEGFHCDVSEADEADYECAFILAGVIHKHFYVKAGGKWKVVYEEGQPRVAP